MTRAARRVTQLVLACAMLLAVCAGATAQPLAIAGYEKAGERRVTRTLTEFTYRVVLTNAGAAIQGAAATVSTVSASTSVADAAVRFGPVSAGASATSQDTFTFTHDRSVPFDWSSFRWTITVDDQNAAPAANAGPDQTVPLSARVQLDGSGSSDADGDPLTFAWSFDSRPSGSSTVLSSAVDVRPTFVADVAGTYVLRLLVSDGSLDSAPDLVVITTRNSAPVADAGPDQTVFPGARAFLDGSGSGDVDGDPLIFAWTFVSKPATSAADLDDATAAAPSFVVDAPGSYVLRLVVHDGISQSAPDDVTISTQNSRPVAEAGLPQTVPVGTTVMLDGRGSSDADGEALVYAWSITTRPAGSAATLSNAAAARPTFVADLDGTYVVQLIVDDGTIASEPDTVTVTTSLPEVRLEAPDWRAAEANSDPGTFTFTRSGPTGDALRIAFSVAGNAGNGVDYVAIASTVTIPAGAASVDLVIQPIDDALFEIAESVHLTLLPDPAYAIGTPGIVELTIIDDDSHVSVVATDGQTSEDGGDSGAFTFSRIGPDADPLVVHYTMTGSATAGTDYVSLSGSITIPAGSSSVVLPFVPVDDAATEGPEAATLVLTPDPSYAIGIRQATITIFDDELPAVTIVSGDDDAAEAGRDPAAFTVHRTGPTAMPLTVSYAVHGSATNGVDYEAIPGTITIPSGAASATVAIVPIDDGLFEGSEHIILSLSAGTGYVVVVPGVDIATLVDDDGAQVAIVASDPTASEAGDTGTFTISRTGGDVTQSVLVHVSRGGTATNGLDYQSLGGATFFVTIPANALAATVTIRPTADTLAEGQETVVLTILPRPEYAVVSPGAATVTIAGG